jgi:hypothetical protein
MATYPTPPRESGKPRKKKSVTAKDLTAYTMPKKIKPRTSGSMTKLPLVKGAKPKAPKAIMPRKIRKTY